MFSATAGAASVTACEMSKVMSDLARNVIRKNGLQDRINIISKKSTNLVIPIDLASQ